MDLNRNYNPRKHRSNSKILEMIEPKCNHCGHNDVMVLSQLDESVALKCKACNNVFEIQLLLG